MSNLPSWIVGVLVIAAIVLFGVLRMGSGPTLQPAVVDVALLPAHSQEVDEGLYGAPVAQVRTGEVHWLRVEQHNIPMHFHGQHEILYILQGQATMMLADGTSTTLSPGQLIIIPAQTAASFEASTADLLLFTTPPEHEGDTVWLEGPMAKPGAKADPTKKPQIIDPAQRIAQGLDQQREGLQFTVVFSSQSGSVELFRIDQGVALHKHPKENHVLYILRGRGLGTIGDKTA
jgi:quercetin dioxygenase-like cupin family protein